MQTVPSFVRNVMGSSAGAGSGEFHVYRHLRRKEYARQKCIQAKSMREQLDDEYQAKLEKNRIEAEAKTAKKRAKRQKRKQRAKKPKTKPDDEEEEKQQTSDDDDDEDEGGSTSTAVKEIAEKEAFAGEAIEGAATETEAKVEPIESEDQIEAQQDNQGKNQKDDKIVGAKSLEIKTKAQNNDQETSQKDSENGVTKPPEGGVIKDNDKKADKISQTEQETKSETEKLCSSEDVEKANSEELPI